MSTSGRDFPVLPVEPLRFPLWGSRLIEASAGTGKTYTIAALYLRLVLGHGGAGEAFGSPGASAHESVHEVLMPSPDWDQSGSVQGGFVSGHDGGRLPARPLTPPEILVVTFTDAATQELRDRIRARLAEAARFFQESAQQARGATFAQETESDEALLDADEAGEWQGSDGVQDSPHLGGEREGEGNPRQLQDLLPRAADPLLQGIRDSFAPEDWSVCARRLQLAAEWMDEAAIFTIHGWCNRMLREHAFDSRGLFDQELSDDTSELLAEACRDYWREFCQHLGQAEAMVLQGWWNDPETLQKAVAGLMDKRDALHGEGMSPEAAIGQMLQRRREVLEQLKAPWREGWIEALDELVVRGKSQGWIDGRKYPSNHFSGWLERLRVWAFNDDLMMVPFGQRMPETVSREQISEWNRKLARVDPAGVIAWSRLSASGMRAVGLKESADPVGDRNIVEALSHPALVAMDALPAQLLALAPDGQEQVLLHAVHWIEARYRAARDRQSQMDFNDLLTQLLRALESEGGVQLAARIRDQYPVAMIDEFQDTDAVQYGIFDHVYRVRQNLPAQALIMIGDPKQAIYGFRGGDIFTYLQAREATRGRHYTLDTNFRSSGAMVRAVNHLFGMAEQRVERGGAFRFMKTRALAAGDATAGDDTGECHAQELVEDNPLPFVPVNAKGRKTVWHDSRYGAQTPALTCWMMPPMPDTDSKAKTKKKQKGEGDGEKGISATQYRAHYAQVTAAEIARLLMAGACADAYFEDEDGSRHPVKPADIAVLVNSFREAQAVRTALRDRGIRSVYLSDKASVFETPVVPDLLHWLQACAEPGNARLVRAALATGLCGLDAETLLRLTQDELYWEEQVARFQRYRDIWRWQGVLPMIRLMLQEFHVVEQLLARDEERTLTDLLHLSELLQAESVRLEGEHALIRYLREQMKNPRGEQKARLQRLESDDARVRVVTVHKSKGLEYPLVFLPYACAVKREGARNGGNSKQSFVRWHDGQGRLQITLLGGGGMPEDVQKMADEERLGEDLRKLYVALTRARYATWVGLAPLKDLEHSAVGHLLGMAAAPGGEMPQVEDALQGYAEAAPDSAGPKQGTLLEARVLELVRTGQPGELVMEQTQAGSDAGAGTDADGHLKDTTQQGMADTAVAWKAAPALRARAWPRWWIASYSALEKDDRLEALSSGTARGPEDGRLSGAVSLRGEAFGHEDGLPAALGGSDAPYGDSPMTEKWAEQRAADDLWIRKVQADDAGLAGEGGAGALQVPEALQAGKNAEPRAGWRGEPEPGEPEAREKHGPVDSLANASRTDGLGALPVLPGVHEFPRGPQAGTFLHGLLEWAGRQGFAAVAADRDMLAEQVQRRLQRMPAWQPWEGMLTDWLLQVLTQPLQGAAVTQPVATHMRDAGAIVMPALADLQLYQAEMSFMLAAHRVDLPALDAWVRRNTLGGAPRPALLPGQINGMLKGFVDLVFEHGGRYFVLDYKSNWLGTSDAAYRQDVMQEAVLAHRYELQYLFYCLALHRLLKVRLPDYDYDRHVGGALYLFLRGVSAPSRGVFVARPPREVIGWLDEVFAGRARLPSVREYAGRSVAMRQEGAPGEQTAGQTDRQTGVGDRVRAAGHAAATAGAGDAQGAGGDGR